MVLSQEERIRIARWQRWLLELFEIKQLDMTKLAEMVGTSRAVINRYLLPPSSPSFRRVTHTAALNIARALNVDPAIPLGILGLLPGKQREATLKKDALALVEYLPDEVLVFLVPVMRALVQNQVQEKIHADLLNLMRSGSGIADLSVEEHQAVDALRVPTAWRQGADDWGDDGDDEELQDDDPSLTQTTHPQSGTN